LLVASTDVPVSNVKELVALAKAKPGQINFGSTGPGSMPHLAGELLRINAGSASTPASTSCMCLIAARRQP
jgi:tripartite-type tricarboxylate transporter receptor subunit TctC